MMKWEREGAGLPSFFLLPAEEFYRTAPDHTSPRVEFPDDSVFTENYALLSVDPGKVRTFMTPDRRGALGPQLTSNPSQYIEGQGDLLFWFRNGYLPPPEVLDGFIATGDRVSAALLYT